jgi:hypothetical protein
MLGDAFLTIPVPEAEQAVGSTLHEFLPAGSGSKTVTMSYRPDESGGTDMTKLLIWMRSPLEKPSTYIIGGGVVVALLAGVLIGRATKRCQST